MKRKDDHKPNGPDYGPEPSPFITSSPLLSYLMNPTMPEEVQTLANIGVTRYQNDEEGLKSARRPMPDGGGRSGDWILATFGKNEDDIVDEFKKLAAPPFFSIEDIEAAYREIINKYPAIDHPPKAKFTLIKDLGISYLHEYPLAKESFVQLASQYNYLESTEAYVVPVSNYLSDPTQGPFGSIEAAAAALFRFAAVVSEKLPHALINVLPAGHENYYKDGYLKLYHLEEARLKTLYEHMRANINKLYILPQWAINEPSGTKMFQVFAAAPSYQGRAAPAIDSFGGKISSLLLEAQYRALAQLAVIRSLLLSGAKVNVHLTLVGLGVFHNPPEAIGHSFKAVAETVIDYPQVNIFVHGKTTNDQNRIRTQAATVPVIELVEMDKDQFAQAR